MIDYEKIARIAHEVNRAYCTATGDYSQPAWGDAPQWQKDSAIAGVKYAEGNPHALPEHSHQSWLKQKVADGWKYGPAKDPDKKEHPCMVEYKLLPEAQRVKDFLFLAVCRAALEDDASQRKAALDRLIEIDGELL